MKFLQNLPKPIQKFTIPELLIGIALITIMAFRLFSSMAETSQTVDEAVHLTAGYSYIETGDFRLNPEHPALIKLISGASQHLLPDLEFDTSSSSWQNAKQWDIGREFVYENTESHRTILTYARTPIVIITLLGALLVWLWSRSLFTPTGGLLSLTLYTLDPNIIAHGQLVTTDVPLAVTYSLAIITFLWWLKAPSTPRLITTGITLSIALLTKFSAIFLLPTLTIIAFIHVWQQSSPKKSTSSKQLGDHIQQSIQTAWHTISTACIRYLKPALIILITFAGITIITYGFEVREGNSDPGFTEFITKNTNTNSTIRNITLNTPVPAYSYIRGLTLVAEHNAGGHDSFLLGEHNKFGWWYYFPVAIATKTPIAIFILTILTAVLAFKFKRAEHPDIRTSLQHTKLTHIALIITPLFYLLVSMNSQINLGLRHVLPIYPLWYVSLGVIPVLAKILNKQTIAFATTTIALIWLAVASSWIHPHYISYFNELAGGPRNGHTILLDSNIDWGQDLYHLKNWMTTNNVPTVYLKYFGTAVPEAEQISSQPLPTNDELTGSEKIGGFAVISSTDLFDKTGKYSWLQDNTPFDRIGYSLWVFDLR